LEIATYLAQTLVCENPHPFADETCWSCLRVADGNYADIVVYDGSVSTIKKDDIQNLETSFEKTPVEPADA
jgi:DNA polymerase-3 subunit delta'